jgi:hypothetical protein
VLAAACEVMRFLQDRQAHTPEEMFYPRERKVLRSSRQAVRRTVREGEEIYSLLRFYTTGIVTTREE